MEQDDVQKLVIAVEEIQAMLDLLAIEEREFQAKQQDDLMAFIFQLLPPAMRERVVAKQKEQADDWSAFQIETGAKREAGEKNQKAAVARAKSAILSLGESVRSSNRTVSYIGPSLIFDSDLLMEYAKEHPDVLTCRKEKAAYVKGLG
jgi:hypothetical protein